MDKQDFFRLYGAHEQFESALVFAWFHWRKEQGLDWRPEGEYKVTLDYKTKTITATSSFGVDSFPATEIYKEQTNSIEMLWYNNCYDGPICGVGKYDGQYVWYDVSEYEDDNLYNIRKYKLYALTHEEYDCELRWHMRFVEEVQKREHDDPIFRNFYKDAEKRIDPDYTERKCIGEFDECLFTRTYKTVD